MIGPNGAGKTTLLRAISKLIDITGGDIRMEGQSLQDVPAHEVIGLRHCAGAGEPAPVSRASLWRTT